MGCVWGWARFFGAARLFRDLLETTIFVWDTCSLMQMSLYLTRVPLGYPFFDVTFRGSLLSQVSGS